MDFVPLHIYSGYSFLQSALVAETIPLLAKKLGYEKVGISDNGTLSGFAPFFHSSEKAGVKAIFGMDYPTDKGVFSLFVNNEEGYRNLLSLTLECSEHSSSLASLAKHKEGLSIVFNCETSFLFSSFSGMEEKGIAEELSSILKGLGDVYLSLPYLPSKPDFVSFLRSFSENHSYSLIAFPMIAYRKSTDSIALKILRSIDLKEELPKDLKEENGDSYFLEPSIVTSFYKESEISLTMKIANDCDAFSYLSKRGKLLKFPLPEGAEDASSWLRKLSNEGLGKKIATVTKTYQDRLDYELGIIDKMGYSDYFLIVADYVNFAKTHGVYVGPGRGSGPASLVSFALDISIVDPIENGLLFERFLNPERLSMPDIDVDFSDVNRDLVVQYLERRYGKDRVSHILTTQTIGAKEALRDIGRVFDYQDREISLIISSLVDDRLSLREDYKKNPQFKRLIDSDPYYLRIVSLASKIEGLPRQAGLHAAGIVINEDPLPDVLPTKNEEGVGYVACLERDYLEEQGFLKMDLLGLRNLSIIETCLCLIKQDTGVSLDYYSIPYHDEEPIELIRNGETMGLFQLESAGMKRAIAEVCPTTFDDVAALLALFRPGPMDSIPHYARRKKGLEAVTYPSMALEPILKGTYGIIVYQEQIMQIVQVMAGFSLGEADLFRRAISKKDAVKLEALKGSFLEGCKKMGREKEESQRVYELIYKFANYGFNKAHAVSYAVLSCQMAYLKKHYPKEFYCSILDFMGPGEGKFKNTLSEMKKRHLSLTNPSINDSGLSYSVKEDKILLPLSAIKGLQGQFVHAIIDERNQNGPFLDFFDFARRMKKDGLSLPNLVKIIDSGAFDPLYKSRASLRATAYSALNYANLLSGNDGQGALLELGIEKPSIIETADDQRSDLEAEYEALGIMVSGSPLSLYEKELSSINATPLSDLGESPSFLTVGIIKSVRAIVTKKGSQMAFMELYDDVSEASFVIFSEVYAASFKSLKEENIVLVRGSSDSRHEGYIAQEIKTLGE